MRRELLFSLVGFLGGFVIAAAVFWESADKTVKVDQAAAVAGEARREPAAAGANGQERWPLVVAAGESEVTSKNEPAVAEAKAPAEIFHEVIGTLKGLDPTKRQAVIDDLVKKLRAAGPEGLKVLRDYFSAGQDVKFQNGAVKMDGQFVMVPTLRASLLVALLGWDGPEAVDLTREILRSTPRLSEATLAVAQLEKRAPGVYRAEAIQMLAELATATGPEEKDVQQSGMIGFINAMKTFKAPELVPAAEALVTKDPWLATQYISALDSMPADVRSAALGRLFANDAVAKNLASNPWSLIAMNYGEPVVAQNVARIFSSSTDKKFRENFLANFANSNGSSNFGAAVVSGGTITADSAAKSVAKLQSRLSFLEQIRPYANTPVLQERWQDAATDLQKAIANPEMVQTGMMRVQAGTLIMNGTVDGAAIKVLQVSPGK